MLGHLGSTMSNLGNRMVTLSSRPSNSSGRSTSSVLRFVVTCGNFLTDLCKKKGLYLNLYLVFSLFLYTVSLSLSYFSLQTMSYSLADYTWPSHIVWHLQGQLADIECVVAGTEQTSGADRGTSCDINYGFRCTNAQQSRGVCLDYKIRYYCTCGRNFAIVIYTWSSV